MNRAAINLRNLLESCEQLQPNNGSITTRLTNNSSAVGPPVPEETKKKDNDDDVWSYLEAQAAFLGATPASLWDSGDLKVELLDMDMEEFLFENGLQNTNVKDGDAAEVASCSPAKALNTPPNQPAKSDLEYSSSSSSSASGSHLEYAKPSNLQFTDSAVQSPVEENAEDSDDSSSIVSFAESSRQSAQGNKQAAPTGNRRKRAAANSISVASSICGNTSDDGSYVPGMDFDPKNRSFTQEELRPQPMSKKSKKQYVPEDLKDEKYWARRRKNNMAAKRSRDARRVKENQIAMRAAFLENEVVEQNAVLKAELDKVNKLYAAALKRLEHYEKQGKK